MAQVKKTARSKHEAKKIQEQEAKKLEDEKNKKEKKTT